MQRKSRTKQRFTWLPTLGTVGPTENDNSAGRAFFINVPEDGSSDVIISPLTFDEPVEGDDLAVNTPLGTVLGNEYFIKRIVGKLFLENQGRRNVADDPSTIKSVLCGAGFFIARASDSQAGGGPTVPIGAASLAERIENYSPLGEDTIREPWIWRRTWTLGNVLMLNFLNEGQDTPPGALFPATNAEYGSVLDGPHIDAKTARRVKQDERLYFAFGVRSWPAQDVVTANEPGVVRGYLDFRILGALRKARQGSSF